MAYRVNLISGNNLGEKMTKRTAKLITDYHTVNFEFYVLFENIDCPTELFSFYYSYKEGRYETNKFRGRRRRLYENKKGKYFIHSKTRVYLD